MEVRVGTASVFGAQRWGVLGCRQGVRKLLSPMYFQSDYDSPAQAMTAIREKAATDASFRTKYAGWVLYPLRLDAGNCFRVKP